MTDKTKFAVFIKDETVMESIYKDFTTGSMVAFCVYISQGSTWWTFVTGLMFILFLFAKISSIMKRDNEFKSKKELQEWVDSLPERWPPSFGGQCLTSPAAKSRATKERRFLLSECM